MPALNIAREEMSLMIDCLDAILVMVPVNVVERGARLSATHKDHCRAKSRTSSDHCRQRF